MENGNGIRPRRAGIKSIVFYLPADVLTNDELASEWASGATRRRLSRRPAPSRAVTKECSSDLGVAVAPNAHLERVTGKEDRSKPSMGSMA
jgi:hypothetical protein